MKNKILLINPRFPRPSQGLNIPMGLMCIGSFLAKHGWAVHIIDANNEPEEGERLNGVVREQAADALCAGFSVMSAQVPHALSLSRQLRRYMPSLPIIWGGIHPTLYPVQTAEASEVDFVVRGEGEQSMLALVHALAHHENYESIRGIAFSLPEGRVIRNPEPRHLDMNEIPPVRWELLADIARIGNLAEVERKTLTGLPLQTSRGCSHRCSFCVNSIMRDKYRYKAIPLLIEELAALNAAGVARINFLDEIFFFNRTRVLAFLDQYQAHGFRFRWFGSVRCDYFRPGYLNLSILRQARLCGCTILGVGAESGSQRVLADLKKDITVSDILNTATLLHQAGIKGNFSFMIGLPGETRADVRETLRLIAKITSVDSQFKILGPQIYRPYPGSELYRLCLAAGMREPDSLRAWSESPYIRAGNQGVSRQLYPWIQFPLQELENVLFYASLAGKKTRFPRLTRLVRQLAAARCRNFCFFFPFEKFLYNIFSRLGFNRLLRNRSVQ